MEIRTLYRYEREDGKTTVSPNKPDGSYEETYRVIADEGKLVTMNGVDTYSVIDTNLRYGWYEVNAPEREEDELFDVDRGIYV